MKRVLVLQHTWEDPVGTLGEIMQERDIAFDTLQVLEEPLPAHLLYDALLILGGPEYAGDDHLYPYLPREKALIRESVAGDIPFLGVCLGGQLLASAMGAPVARNGLFELGFYRAELTQAGQQDPLFQGLPGYQQVFHWHSDIFALPEGATALTLGDNGVAQAFRVGRCAYGMQYHIELTPEMFDTWMRFHPHREDALDLLGHERYQQVEREFPDRYPIYRAHTRHLFENFLSLVEGE